MHEKRILITGAANGIGFGIAESCVGAGAEVMLTDIDGDGVAKAARRIGSGAQAAELDVTDTAAIRDFFDNLDTPIDGLVNNAGVTLADDFLEFAESDLERLWATDLRSVFCMCQAASKKMKDNGGGAIVNVSSVHAGASTPGFEMYAAAKAGVNAMSRAMSWSLGAFGIRVNTLSPGLTHTQAVADVLIDKPHLSEPFNAIHASGRYATVDEVAQIATFLLSDASAAITGADIIADHGASALLVRSEDIV